MRTRFPSSGRPSQTYCRCLGRCAHEPGGRALITASLTFHAASKSPRRMWCIQRAPRSSDTSGVTPYHSRAEVRELANLLRRTRMVRHDAARLRRETERDRHVEVVERRHLSVEPRVRIRTQAVRPAQARAQLLHAELLQPPYAVVEPVIFEMKPLAHAKLRRELVEMRQR